MSSAIFPLIWRLVARIPRGRVATYGQIARMAGLGGGARTVGWALRALPDDLEIDGRPVPWQRVINAQGRISPRCHAGDAGGGARQAAALRRDGVRVAPDGTIDLDRRLWSGRPAGRPPRSRTAAGTAGGRRRRA